MQTAGQVVAHQLRRRIVEGHWAPGARLPQRQILAAELGSCLATVQEAVTQMAAEGFVRVGSRKQGTFVAEHPPHLHHYRVIFPFAPGAKGQFWRALEEAASQRAVDGDEFSCFYGLSGHRDIAEYRGVVAEVETARVAGLIFASSAGEFHGTPLLDQPGVARVAIASAYQLPGIPKVEVDIVSFVERAVDHLLAIGRRRIALICADHAIIVRNHFRLTLQARGLASRSIWEQYANPDHPHAAGNVAELLMHIGQEERPDGLIVADDNLLSSTTAGLRVAGVRVPEELAVVALTNFPNYPTSDVPVTRLGFDVPALLDLLVLRLEQVRRGEVPPESTTVKAVFDHELAVRRQPAT